MKLRCTLMIALGLAISLSEFQSIQAAEVPSQETGGVIPSNLIERMDRIEPMERAGIKPLRAVVLGNGVSVMVDEIPPRPAGVYLPTDPGVVAPVLTSKVEIRLSREARKAGVVLVAAVSLVVDVKGRPGDVVLLRSIRHSMAMEPVGYGMDKEVVQKVQKWRFRPCRLSGSPVPCQLTFTIELAPLPPEYSE